MITVSKDQFEKVLSSNKFHKIEFSGIDLTEKDNLIMYAREISQDEILLVTVYHCDIATSVEKVKGKLIHCDGLYTIDHGCNEEYIITNEIEENIQPVTEDTEEECIIDEGVKPSGLSDINDTILNKMLNSLSEVKTEEIEEIKEVEEPEEIEEIEEVEEPENQIEEKTEFIEKTILPESKEVKGKMEVIEEKEIKRPEKSRLFREPKPNTKENGINKFNKNSDYKNKNRDRTRKNDFNHSNANHNNQHIVGFDFGGNHI